MKRIIAVVAILVLVLTFFAGCGNKGIEGTWVLVEEYDASGTRITSKELEKIGVSEKYEISGTKASYTCVTAGMKKPISLNFVVEDLGNNNYAFKLNDRITFASPTVKGNTMTYEAGKGKNATKMVFKRK